MLYDGERSTAVKRINCHRSDSVLLGLHKAYLREQPSSPPIRTMSPEGGSTSFS